MRCEVVAVGTELLLGQVVDTNSAWIGEKLALAGIDSLHQVRVGDNVDRIVAVLRDALARADAVLVCGGLGPTHDDVTREAIAEVMDAPLELDETVAAVIRQMFASRRRPMPENNLRQAMVPRGATVIPQVRGTAPGLICPVGDQVVYAVPGVPTEMEEMVTRAVLPDLQARSGDPAVILSRTIRTWGESESGLAERLAGLIAKLEETGSPTLAFLASGIEGLKVRLTAKAADEETARALLDVEETAVRAELGGLVFGVDGQAMEDAVGQLLVERSLTLGLAESVTGGLVAARLTGVPGAGTWFRGSVVSYASDVKHQLLDVPEGPVVSDQAAAAMAEGAAVALGADVGLALTGVAGPTEQDGRPVGTLHVGIHLHGETTTSEHHLPGERDQMRGFAVITALDLLRRRLLTMPPDNTTTDTGD